MASNNLNVNLILDDELAQKRQELMNKNTIKSEKNAKRKFESYLKACQIENIEEWLTFSDEKLDDLLVKFWFSIRTNKGDYLSVASLQNIRHTLNRLLNKSGRSVDIIKDTAFKKSIQSYKDATKELKKLGKAIVKHYPEIHPTGNLMYTAIY